MFTPASFFQNLPCASLWFPFPPSWIWRPLISPKHLLPRLPSCIHETFLQAVPLSSLFWVNICLLFSSLPVEYLLTRKKETTLEVRATWVQMLDSLGICCANFGEVLETWVKVGLLWGLGSRSSSVQSLAQKNSVSGSYYGFAFPHSLPISLSRLGRRHVFSHSPTAFSRK